MFRCRVIYRPGLEVINVFSCSTTMSMKFIMLMNVKMPTSVGILTLICMINTTYIGEFESKTHLYFFEQFYFYEQLKFNHAQLS